MRIAIAVGLWNSPSHGRVFAGWPTDGRVLPPKDGDVWRMDFSRFNTYKEAPPAQDSGGWFCTPHGVWDSHIPECFVYVRFSTDAVKPPEGKPRIEKQ